MANGPEFDNAVNLARFTPSLGIGCHVDLVQLAPVSPPSQVSSLLDDHEGGPPRFRQGLARLFTAVLLGDISAAEILAEATAQMRKIQAAGLRLTHFDSHKHTHALLPLLSPMLRAASDCGIRAVRNPFEPQSLLAFRHLAGWRLRSRYVAVRVLNFAAHRFRRAVQEASLVTTDGTVGVVLTGSLDQRRLCELLRRVPDGTWELVTHPGYVDPALAPLTSLVESREIERELLTSGETRRELHTCGIELISYADV